MEHVKMVGVAVSHIGGGGVAAIAELADPTDTDYFNADGIHLITAGYTLVAALVGAAVDQLFHGGARY